MSTTTQFTIRLNGVDTIVNNLTEAGTLVDVLRAKLAASNGAPAVQRELAAALVVVQDMTHAAAVYAETQKRASAEAAKAVTAQVDAMEKAARDAVAVANGAKPIITLKLNGTDTALFTMGEVEQAVETLKAELKTIPDSSSAAFKAMQLETVRATSKLEEMEVAIEFLTPEKKIGAFVALGGAITGALSLGSMVASKFATELGISEEATKKLDSAIMLLNAAQQGYQTILLATSGENAKNIRQTALLIAGNIRTAASNATVAASYTLASLQARLFGTAARTALTATGIGVFIVALSLLVQYWEEVKNGAEKMGAGVKSVFGGLLDFYRDFYSTITLGLVDGAKAHAIKAAEEEVAAKGKLRAKDLEDSKARYDKEVSFMNVSEAEKKRLVALNNKNIYDAYATYYNGRVSQLKQHYDLTNAEDKKKFDKELSEDKKRYEELRQNFRESNIAFQDATKKANQDAIDVEFNHRKKLIELSTASDATKAKQLLSLQKKYASDSNKALDSNNDAEYKTIIKNKEDVLTAEKTYADAAKKSAQEKLDFELSHAKKLVELSTASEIDKAKKLLDLQRTYATGANKLLNASNEADYRAIVKNNEDVLAAEKAFQDAKRKLEENEIKRSKSENDLAKAKLDAESNLTDGLLAIDLEYQNALADIKLRQLNKEKVYQSEIDKLNVETDNKRTAVTQKFNKAAEDAEREHQATLRAIADDNADIAIADLQRSLVDDDVIEKQHFSKRIATIRANAATERAIAKAEADKANSGNDGKYGDALANLRTRYDAEIKLAGDSASKLAEIDTKYAKESEGITQNYANTKLKIQKDLAKKNDDIRKKDTEAEKAAADAQKEYLLQKVGQVADLANGILDVMSQAITNKLDRMVADIDAKVDTTNQAIDGLKDAISESQSNVDTLEGQLEKAKGNQRDSIIKKLELERQKQKQLTQDKLSQENQLADLDKQKEALQDEAAAKKKRIAISQALINTALGVTLAFATTPFPLSLVNAALVAATGAVQLAAINQTKYRQGGTLANNGVIEGPAHEAGGIQLFHKNGAHLGEMEGGEHITNTAATRRNREALDTINRYGDSTTFTVVAKKFALGGVVGDYQGVEADLKAGAVSSTDIALQYLMQDNANTKQELLALHNKSIVVVATDVTSTAKSVEVIQTKALKH